MPPMDTQLEQARDWFLRGIEHFEAGRLEPACEAFQTALGFAPGRPSVLGNLGITLFRLGRLADAVPVLRQATAADPGYADAWTSLGLSLAAQSRWQDADNALARAAVLAPPQAEVLVQHGQCLLQLGRAHEALEAYDLAIETRPAYADAWVARGNLLRDMQQLDAAAAAFERALALGADPELTGYYLASVRGITTAAPRRYVESLFDQYAPDFQSHVISTLRYQGHERLLRPLIDARQRFGRALDLGCGTGLCGQLIRPLVDVLEGVDLSQAMVEQSRGTGLYDTLTHADVGDYLKTAQCPFDLVMAADVFIYVGDLTEIFPAVRRLLSAGGRFVFTAEASVGEDVQLLPSLRYAHAEAYIRRLAEANGFRVDAIESAPIRYDQEKPIDGMYVYLG